MSRSVEERLSEHILQSDDCWEWVGVTTRYAYFGTYDQEAKRSRVHLAHRYVYEHCKGAIPDGLTIDHLCRNTHCVNPDHLEAVTLHENCLRAPTWPGNRTHCPRGHEYTKTNTYVHPTRGYRRCKRCTLDYKISLRARKKVSA